MAIGNVLQPSTTPQRIEKQRLKVRAMDNMIDSTIDYPGHTSTIIFFDGCNLNCKYCQNYELITGCNDREQYVDDALSAMVRSSRLNDAVVFSGGECTLQPVPLRALMLEAKKRDKLVGIETNGFAPDVLEKLFIERLVDMLFIDVKAPLDDPSYYAMLTGSALGGSAKLLITKSIKLAATYCIPTEIRITLPRSMLAHIGTVNAITKSLPMINCAFDICLQQCQPVLGRVDGRDRFTRDELFTIGSKIRPSRNIKSVYISTRERGRELVF